MFNSVTGAILLNTPLSAGSNAPVTIDGDDVITGAAGPRSGRPLIIAYNSGPRASCPHRALIRDSCCSCQVAARLTWLGVSDGYELPDGNGQESARILLVLRAGAVASR